MLKKFNLTSRIFIIGDLNQDLISGRGDHLISLMNSYNFSNSVSEPTHHQGASSTLIDIVFANNKDIDRTTVLSCPFSNHSFVVCHDNFSSAALTKSSVVGRILNEKNLTEIRKILASENHRFDSIDLFDDVNDKFFAFTKAIMSVVDEVAPLKKFRLKKSNAIPWIDSELLELIAAKDHLHKAAINSGTRFYGMESFHNSA